MKQEWITVVGKKLLAYQCSDCGALIFPLAALEAHMWKHFQIDRLPSDYRSDKEPFDIRKEN